MGTVSGLIDSARYDLIDYETGIVFDDAELLEYLNRMIGVMDSQFAALNSSFVHGIEENIDTVESQDYVDIGEMNNGNWDSIRSVWIGDDRLTGLPLDLMYYERKFRSGDAYPNYWSLEGDRILFETTCSESFRSTFTATNATNRLTITSAIEYDGDAAETADGPYRLYGVDLPLGLYEGVDYYLIVVNTTTVQLASTAALATAGTAITFSDDGTGTLRIHEANDLIIHYNKKHRPRLSSWAPTFTAESDHNIFKITADHTFNKGDGRFQVSNSGGALPAGLVASTDYWIIPLGDRHFKLASTRADAMEGTAVSITDDGSGTNTITLTDYMPYNGRMDDFLREMLVMYAKGKREGQVGSPDQMYQSVFRKRAMEETLRRERYIKEYHMDW